MNRKVKVFNYFVQACVLAMLIMGIIVNVAEAKFPDPKKPIIFIVPVAVGGGYDTYTRLLAPYLTKELGVKNVIIRNIPGAGWKIGYQKIFRAKPDGYTIGIWNPGPMVNDRDILGKVDYDMTTFTFIYRITDEPRVVMIKSNGPVKDFNDMIDKGKSSGFQLRAASDGGVSLIDIKLMEAEWGVKVSTIVPYTGGSKTRMAVIRGDAHFTTASLGSGISSYSSGLVKLALLINDKPITQVPEAEKWLKEMPELKNIPIPSDLGLKSLSYVGKAARAVIAPPGLPKDIKMKLEKAIERIMKNKEFRKKALKGNRPLGSGQGGDEYAERMKRDKKALIKIKHLIE